MGGSRLEFIQLVIEILEKNWPMFLRGTAVTLIIALIGTLFGAIIGIFIGVIRTIPMLERGIRRILLKLINAVFAIYIEVFRGTPMIVQAMVIFYGSAIAFGWDMDRMFAAYLIVSINTGAYMAEIVRGGIISVDAGQYEAAQAIGMNHMQTMRHIVLPQVLRNILPATGNHFIINIKDTSVLNVISVSELFFQTKSVAGSNFHWFESFAIASAIYFVLTFTISILLRAWERKLEGPKDYVKIDPAR